MSHSKIEGSAEQDSKGRVVLGYDRHDLDYIVIKHQGDKLAILAHKDGERTLPTISVSLLAQTTSTYYVDSLADWRVHYQRTVETLSQHKQVVNLVAWAVLV